MLVLMSTPCLQTILCGIWCVLSSIAAKLSWDFVIWLGWVSWMGWGVIDLSFSSLLNTAFEGSEKSWHWALPGWRWWWGLPSNFWRQILLRYIFCFTCDHVHIQGYLVQWQDLHNVRGCCPIGISMATLWNRSTSGMWLRDGNSQVNPPPRWHW